MIDVTRVCGIGKYITISIIPALGIGNCNLTFIITDTITTANDLMYAASVIVSENLGMTREPTKVRKEPWWRRRLTNQIEQMRTDLSRIERLKSGHPIKDKYKDELQRKYWLKERGMNHVTE